MKLFNDSLNPISSLPDQASGSFYHQNEKTSGLKILFDGACPFCQREIQFMKKKNKEGKLSFEDISLQDFSPQQYGLTQEEVEGIIHGILPDGKVIKRIDVFILAYQLLGFGWLVKPLSWPLIRPLAELAYSLFARYRVRLGKLLGTFICDNKSCRLS